MRIVTAALLVAVWAANAAAQALPNITSLGVRYTTVKNAAHANGELKAQLDEVDTAIAEARRTGNASELRRQYARGFALLNHEAWTPALDYKTSLVLRSERTVIDSALPYTVRLEQLYRPAMDLASTLTAKATVRPRVAPARAGEPPPATPRRDLGTFDSVSRDLRDSPLSMELDLGAVNDGAMIVEVEVFDGATSLGSASLNVFVSKNLDARLRALESKAAGAPASIRADIAYPADVIRNVNRARIELLDFNVGEEVARAESLAAAGKDPFTGRTGDMERHYLLEGANEIMPYRVYVPTTYKAGTPMPLVIALHGLGGNEDGFFDNYAKLAPQLAEKHGMLMAAPLGFRRDGFYGSPLTAGTDPASKRRMEYSEKDVLEVLRRMRAMYNVDESRIYLMGHSMGAIGTWWLGSKYHDTWAALVAFSGVGAATLADNMKGLPHFIVHGDNDNTVNVSGSRNMVAALKKLNADVTYTEVPGGSHTDVIVPYLPQAFAFMASHRKAVTGGRPYN